MNDHKRNIIFAALICLACNVIKGNQIQISVSNCLSLLFSLIFTFRLIKQNRRESIQIPALPIILLGLIPLFHFSPNYQMLPTLICLITICLNIFLSLNHLALKLTILIPIFFLIILTSLISGNIVHPNFTLDIENTIFKTPSIEKAILRQQETALYVPYRLRSVIYSHLIYLHVLFGNISSAISLYNLYSTILLCNLYSLFVGLYCFFKKNTQKEYLLVVLPLIFSLLSIGVNKHQDKFNFLYTLGFIFTYFIVRGLRNINYKIYSALFLLSLILL